MQAVKPLSSGSASNDPAINTTNYPGLAFCLRPEGVTNGVKITDSIGGLIIAGAGFLNHGNGTFTAGVTDPVAIQSGHVPMPGTKNILHIYVGSYDELGGVMYYGDNSLGDGWGLGTQGSGDATNGFLTHDINNYLDMPNLTKSSLLSGGAIGLYVDMSASTGRVVACDSAGAEVGTCTQHIAGGISPMNSSNETNARLCKPAETIYGHYVFFLTNDLTTNFVDAAVAWMSANPTRIYPGLRGLA